MNILIFSPNLKASTGSPIRAVNIVKGLSKYSNNFNISLASTSFEDNFTREYSCYDINKHGGVDNTIKVAVEEGDIDAIFCITHAFADSASKMAKRFNIPFFVDIHGIRALEIIEERRSVKSKLADMRVCIPWFVGVLRAKSVFCANPKLYSWLRFFLGRKVVNVCGLVDVSKFEMSNRNNKITKVLYAGNFNPYQGVDLFIDAIDALKDDPEIEFYIVGNSSMLGEDLKNKMLNSKEYKNVTILSSIDYKQYPRFLDGMDVFVVPRRPSITAYLAFPQKIVESMSAGRCVIATNLAPHKLALANPECGILCSPTPKSLADAIIKSKDGKLRKRLGGVARKKALANYDLSVQILKIIKAIESGSL